MEYAVRLRKSYVDPIKFELFLNTLFSEGSGYLFVEEQGTVEDNIHYQGTIKTDINSQALISRIRRIITKNGNQAYSCKVVRDIEKYHYYLLKGNSRTELPKIIKSHIISFSKDKIKEIHRKYWEIKDNTKNKNQNMIDYLYDKLKVYEDGDVQATIVKELVNYYIVNRKPMNTFHMKSQAKLLNCMLSENYKTAIINDILRDL